MPRSEPLYGWVVVFAAALLSGLGLGGLASLAVFLKPLAAEFGWSRGNVSMAYMIGSISTAVVGVCFGRIADLHGVRALAWIGAGVFGYCFVALSFQTSLWHLYAVFALFGGLGVSTTLVPLTSAVSHWFTANRGLAVGIATAGAAVGQATVPFIAGLLIVAFGWRTAFLYLGMWFLAIGAAAAALVRDREASDEFSGDDERVVLRSSFVGRLPPRHAITWVSTAAIFCCICMVIPLVHVAALANDRGIDPEQAAGIMMTMVLSGAAGRFIAGKISDLTGALPTYMFVSLLQTAAVLWFTQVSTNAGFYLVGVIFGLSFGGVMTSFLLTIRSLLPAEMAGRGMAIVILFGWIGMGTGAYAGGLLFDVTGDYFSSYALAALSGVVNLTILCALFLRLQNAGGGRAYAA